MSKLCVRHGVVRPSQYMASFLAVFARCCAAAAPLRRMEADERGVQRSGPDRRRGVSGVPDLCSYWAVTRQRRSFCCADPYSICV